MSTGGHVIRVSGLAPETSEEKLHDFFSFCGKLVRVTKEGDAAEIEFEKLSAMRTSLTLTIRMLNGGTLDGAHLEVTSVSEEPKAASILPPSATGATPIGAEISQEDKPKAAIVAEYLASGYVLGDNIVQRAIDFDHKQGISSSFLNFFNSIDHNVGKRVIGENQTVSGKVGESASTIVHKTKEVDQQRGVTSTLMQYYSKLIGTPVGQRFYTTTQKQVLDVHEEAKRIADEKKAAAAQAATTAPSSTAAPASNAAAPGSTVPAAPFPAAGMFAPL